MTETMQQWLSEVLGQDAFLADHLSAPTIQPLWRKSKNQ
jgi:hypothetical protein